MVKMLKDTHKQVITAAIAQAEQQTSAEIVAVVAPASDTYASYVLLYGLTIGSIIALLLWITHVVNAFPLLLGIQLGVVILLSLIPIFHRLCLQFVPKRIRHHYAAHHAYEEYLFASRHVTAKTPLLLFYVSLAERYVHILPNHVVREKIPNDSWDLAIKEFTTAMKTKNIQEATIDTIERLTTTLAQHFPHN